MSQNTIHHINVCATTFPVQRGLRTGREDTACVCMQITSKAFFTLHLAVSVGDIHWGLLVGGIPQSIPPIDTIDGCHC